jgi:chemotaxis protein CheD
LATSANTPGTHYLHPATLFASNDAHQVTTVLGTCVAVCLWDRVRRVGGINHYMLPLWNGSGLSSPKFGNIAIARLLEKMEQLGSRRPNLIAKLFGGKASGNEHALLNIGERNAELAEQMMREARIEVTARNLGGPFGRKLIFNTQTGEVLLKRHAMA